VEIDKRKVFLDRLESYRNKHVALLFTGGFDSTATLLGLLEVNATVTPVMVEGDFIDSDKAQRQSATSIIRIINDKRIQEMGFIQMGSTFEDLKQFPSQQFAGFVGTAPYFTNKNFDAVIMGVVQGDGIASSLAVGKKIWNSFKDMMIDPDQLPPLEFPYFNINKRILLDAVGCNPVWGDVKRAIIHCEDPIPVVEGSDAFNNLKEVYVNCDRCRSCKRAKDESIGYRHFGIEMDEVIINTLFIDYCRTHGIVQLHKPDILSNGHRRTIKQPLLGNDIKFTKHFTTQMLKTIDYAKERIRVK